ncbi:hypothetical protein T01_7692 [Trichinella spiralis]|uniref:Uncharacterized protein n=1 Tax=Trichinella spiralis TaxID=6334 RepID=A0A0V1B7A6_TRISP|nr:hypothetical protein T01_7692 [Trichinella spiralis]
MGGVVNAITWPQYGKKSPLRSAVPNRFQVFKPIHCFWLAWKEAIGFAVWCLVVVRPHCDLIEHVLISTLIDCVVVVAVYNPECLCQREKEDDNKDMIPSVIVDSVQSLLSEQLPCKKTKRKRKTLILYADFEVLRNETTRFTAQDGERFRAHLNSELTL